MIDEAEVKMGMFSLQVRVESGLYEVQAVLREGAVQIRQNSAPETLPHPDPMVDEEIHPREIVQNKVEEWCEEHEFVYVD